MSITSLPRLAFLFLTALMIGGQAVGQLSQPTAPAPLVVPLKNPHELVAFTVRNEGRWHQSEPAKSLRLNDIRSVIFPGPDFAGVDLPATTMLEVALVLPIGGIDLQKAEDEAAVAALPLSVAQLQDTEWQKGGGTKLSAEYFKDSRDNTLALESFDPAAVKSGSEFRLVWKTDARSLRAQIANGLLVYLDFREQQPGSRNIRSVMLGKGDGASTARLEIRPVAGTAAPAR